MAIMYQDKPEDTYNKALCRMYTHMLRKILGKDVSPFMCEMDMMKKEMLVSVPYYETSEGLTTVDECYQMRDELKGILFTPYDYSDEHRRCMSHISRLMDEHINDLSQLHSALNEFYVPLPKELMSRIFITSLL